MTGGKHVVPTGKANIPLAGGIGYEWRRATALAMEKEHADDLVNLLATLDPDEKP